MMIHTLLLLPALLIFFLVLRMKRPKFRNKFYPKVSVIVWAWESGNVIERRIKNLLSLDYPNDYEIIIVDNASKDETAEICKHFAKKGLIKYYRTKKSWKKKELNMQSLQEKMF